LTTMNSKTERPDREGYNVHYRDNPSSFMSLSDPEEFIRRYEDIRLGPFHDSESTKGYVRGETIRRLLREVDHTSKPRSEFCILDAGSGQGELSVYLSSLGFRVYGVDISDEAKWCGNQLAEKVGVADRCTFLSESLEQTSIPTGQVDFVVGHASLHHFIKYEGVPKEFMRVMADGAKGYFADSFGENKLFRLFHNKEKMQRLGDVSITKEMIENYFKGFSVHITPTDWFVMFDKLYLKAFPKRFRPVVKKMSKLHHRLDRRIPQDSRLALALSGAVLTEIEKCPT
jgi:ubiquinone/menaquinone biosynthesis C-methylase UbiE